LTFIIIVLLDSKSRILKTYCDIFVTFWRYCSIHYWYYILLYIL